MFIPNHLINTVKGRINSNRPVIVKTVNHPTYKNHWVTAYGYSEYRSTAPYTTYLIINNGWGDNGVKILIENQSQYLDGQVWLGV